MSSKKGGGARARSSGTAKVEMARVAARTEVTLRCIPWGGRAVCVAVAYIPLKALQPMVSDLAGKHTDVSIGISISVAINVLLGGAYFVQKRKSKSQREEIIRLRGRLEQVDAERLATNA